MGFDVFHLNDIKYLLPGLFTEGEPKFLHTFRPIFWKSLILVWQQFHYTVWNINQINHHFNPFASADHVTAQWPEKFTVLSN